jgi:uncharacterized protein YndB with AHSA1/START domain
MQEQSIIHNTFVIERSYPVPPERVFAALSDPAKKRRWFLDGRGNKVEYYEMQFEVGGKERARFFHDGPMAGIPFTNDGTYQDIVSDRLSAALTTFELLPTETGTDLIFTHQAAFFEGADGPAMRETGWRTLLERLAAALAN